jgi:hypothetical protein
MRKFNFYTIKVRKGKEGILLLELKVKGWKVYRFIFA